jgi:hypothetical protein
MWARVKARRSNVRVMVCTTQDDGRRFGGTWQAFYFDTQFDTLTVLFVS